MISAQKTRFLIYKGISCVEKRFAIDENTFVLALEAGEMMCLEDEISHLQKENSRIESQLSR